MNTGALRRAVTRVRRVRPPITESVQAWSVGRPDASVTSIRPSYAVERRLPRTVDPPVDPRFVAIAGDRYVVPEKYLARVERACVVGDTGLVVLPDGSFASEVTFRPEHLRNLPAYSQRVARQRRRMPGSYFSLFSLWAHSPNYYHWLHDAMLRLHLVLDRLDDVRFIVPASLAPFQIETLRVLGVDTDRLCPFTGEEVWEVDELYFAPPTTSSGSNCPAALRWFRDACWSAYGLAPTRARRRIFISRRNTRWRRIVNEAELAPVLAGFGFETVCFEDLSFSDQVKLMAESELLVGPSGAALTNLMFMPPGASVLVLVEPVQVSVFFWTMADALGHDYWYAVGETVAGDVPPPADPDLRVSPDLLRRHLDAIVAS